MASIKSKLVDKYIDGYIDSNTMLQYLMDGDYYNAFFALKILKIGKLDLNQREIALNIITENNDQCLMFLYNHHNYKASNAEIKKVFNVIIKDYTTLLKLTSSFDAIDAIKEEGVIEIINQLDIRKASTKKIYDDLLFKIAVGIKNNNMADSKLILKACSEKLELFEQCIEYVTFDFNSTEVFNISSNYFEKRAKKSLQKCYNYCCYFEKNITAYHLDFLIKRIQGSKDFSAAKDLLNKKYRFKAFTPEHIATLESMIVMQQLKGGN
jgi:hypothetical protein